MRGYCVPIHRALGVLTVVLCLGSCGGGSRKANPDDFAKGWKAIQGVDFIIYAPQNSPRSLQGLEAFADACDGASEQIAGQLQIEVKDQMRVYLFTSTEDCEVTTGRPAGFVEGRNIYTRIGAPVGGVIAEAICSSVDPEAKSFPLIRDGVRNFFDMRDINVHYEALALRRTRDWPTLEDLLYRQSAHDPDVYKYASASYVAFLIQRYGIDQFKMLWSSSLELRPSIEKIYGGTLPQMEEEWFRIQDRLGKKT